MKLFLAMEFVGGIVGGLQRIVLFVASSDRKDFSNSIQQHTLRIGSLGQSCCLTWFKIVYHHNLIDRFALVRSVER